MQGVAGALPIMKRTMPMYFRKVFLANTFAFKHCIVWTASLNPMHEQDTQVQSQLSAKGNTLEAWRSSSMSFGLKPEMH